LPSWGLQLLPSSPSLPWCLVFGEPGNVAEVAIITLSHATRRVVLSLHEYLLQYLFKHTQYLFLDVSRSEGSPKPMGYLVPGRVWHGAWTKLLYNINTWNLCRHRFVAYLEIIFHPLPAVLDMLHIVVFAKKCSAQSVKVICYVSLYLDAFPMIWHIPLCACPLLFHTLTPIPWGLLLMAFAKNLAEDQHGSKACPSSEVWAGSRRLDSWPHCSEVVWYSHMQTSLLEVQSLPIKSLASSVQVTRKQEHVKIQAVRNWNNPLLNWLSCLLCLHRLHCLLGGFSCCLHRLLCHDVECLENRVTLLRLQLSPWAMPHDELGLAHVSTCCSTSNLH